MNWREPRRRSRLWWYRRMRRAYKKHGVTIRNRRQTWEDAMTSRRMMPVAEQRALGPLKSVAWREAKNSRESA